jgi:hypothetical protein
MTKSYREQSNEAKAAKRGITEQRRGAGKNKKDKPFILEYRITPDENRFIGPPRGWHDWSKWGSYRTMEELLATKEKQERKGDFFEYRIKGESNE